ncbi:phosphotransferase [Curtobacterium sp. RRHDQ10]|uniref:phosphotransferase n=1 Tax=Curtobacterium phyllosphaerae TaxID=3413379 RepID=UPI003BF2722F
MTTLEMLWERDDPDEVLRTRFGFGDRGAVGRWAVGVLADRWGVQVDACDRVVMSDRNALAWVRGGSRRAVLKWSVAPERFARLEVAAALTAWLGDRGLPVSRPLPTRDGLVQVVSDGVSMSLQDVVVGTVLDVHDPAQVQAAGAVLARLHGAMREFPQDGRDDAVAPPPVSLHEQVSGWLDGGQDPDPSTTSARRLLRRMLDTAPTADLPLQLVHGDYRAANILCTRSEIVAVLDFEELRFDHRVVELARSAVLLGTLFHDWGPVPESVRREFLAGYESVDPLTADEHRWWDVLVLWYSSAFVPAGEDPTGWGTAVAELVGCRMDA